MLQGLPSVRLEDWRMFPLILTVLSRDNSTPYYNPYSGAQGGTSQLKDQFARLKEQVFLAPFDV